MSETALAMVQTTLGASALDEPDERWAVLVTYPQAEEWAQANLALRGYKPYLPLYAVRVRHPRLRWLGQVLRQPLFPGYIFCPHNSADPWRPIRYCPGIRANLLGGVGVQYARAADVEALQATEPFRRSPLPPGAEWAPGDACSLAAGVFKGQPAAVTAIEDEIAEVSVIMLGELRSVRVPVDCLIPRDS